MRYIYIQSKKPKDLVEFLKFAQIYDDIDHRSKGVFGKGKEKEPFSLNKKFFKIEKGGIGVSEYFGGQGKHWKKKTCLGKPKNQSKLAKKNQYDKVGKENLCLNYFESSHAKTACPKLQAGHSSNDAKKDAKLSRRVHIVQ